MERDVFYENLRQEILHRANIEDEERTYDEVFTQRVLDVLNDIGECANAEVCSFSARGVKVSGYDMAEGGIWLDLFVSEFFNQEKPMSIKKADAEKSIKRVTNFFDKATKGMHRDIEESSPAFQLSQDIFANKNNIERVRIFLLTNGLLANFRPQKISLDNGGISIEYHLWDFERIYRHEESGAILDKIEINLKDEFDQSIPCLKIPADNDFYDAYLAVVPGWILVRMYEQHGSRLLERNVRSFLQARGNINKGIRKTIKDEPEMFFAFNNGISATAECVSLESKINGNLMITGFKDFQIVNGGQTTGSLHAAVKKDRLSVDGVFVQMKLSVIKDKDHLDEIVGRISMYANSQNKVQTADFSANDGFHVKIQELSRTIWAPAVDGGQLQTRWFYERARGQYIDEKLRQRTESKMTEFTKNHPIKQMFTKTEMAKYEMIWNFAPHVVSQGGQKNFQVFTVRLKDNGEPVINETYFKSLVAKAIIFNSAYGLYKGSGLSGYRANVVAYSLAWLYYHFGQRINLDRIWHKQAISDNLKEAIGQIFPIAYKHITTNPRGGNITTWFKGEKCWEAFKIKQINTLSNLEDDLISANLVDGTDGVESGVTDLFAKIQNKPMNSWMRLFDWGKKTRNLDPNELNLISSMMEIKQLNLPPKLTQCNRIEQILLKARYFNFDED